MKEVVFVCLNFPQVNHSMNIIRVNIGVSSQDDEDDLPLKPKRKKTGAEESSMTGVMNCILFHLRTSRIPNTLFPSLHTSITFEVQGSCRGSRRLAFQNLLIVLQE